MLMSTISPYLNFSTWVSLYPNMTVTGSPPWEENSTFGYGTAPTPRYYPYPGYEHPDTAEVTIKIVVYSLLLLMALVGNPIVILIVSLNKTMWTPTNFYIMNLAIADLLIALFCMWIHLVQSMIPNWIFGDFMCRFNNFIQGASVASSILTMTVIAMDRFYAIIFPLKARVTDTNAAVVISLVWIAAIAANVPLLVVLEQKEYLWDDGFLEVWCFESWPNDNYHGYRQAYSMFLFVAIYTIPMLVMTGAYAMIGKKLWNKMTPGVTIMSMESAQAKIKKKVIRMLVVLVLVFFVCWTPYQIIQLYKDFRRKGPLPDWFGDLRYAALLLGYANSSFNPIIYGGFNENFRKGFQDAMKITCCRGNRVEPEMPRVYQDDQGANDLELRPEVIETVSEHM
ncbi:QRFP-like peptide receptor [Branchiostoma floridae x Branchiostoma belcheri]